MAQPATITVELDVTQARRKIRGLLSLAREANAELARLEDRIEEERSRLAALGIRLELEEK